MVPGVFPRASAPPAPPAPPMDVPPIESEPLLPLPALLPSKTQREIEMFVSADVQIAPPAPPSFVGVGLETDAPDPGTPPLPA